VTAHKRGRPVGWRKPNRLDRSLMVRLPPDLADWLKGESIRTGLTMSEMVRQLIERQRSS
jgi:predicted DNA-binding protein